MGNPALVVPADLVAAHGFHPLYLAAGLDVHALVEGEDEVLVGLVVHAMDLVALDVVIGEGSVIGGNVWLTQSIPAQSQVFLKDITSAQEVRKKVRKR